MTTQNIKQKGFTIVELLIVIVVIAILAAMSMVAYTNIQNRARTSTAATAAKAVKDTAENHRGANSVYPTTKALFVSGGADPVAKLPADIVFANGAIAAAPSDPKTVRVVPHGTPIAGFTITYWDFSINNTVTLTTGDVSGTAGTNIQ